MSTLQLYRTLMEITYPLEGACLYANSVSLQNSIEGSKVILGIKTTFPACFPPSMRHFRTQVLTSNSIRRVPLQRPWDGSIFLRSIRGQPSLTWRWARGRPETLSELRYSMGYSCWSALALSMPISVNSSPGNFSKTAELRSSTASFLEERMVRSRKYWSGLP